MHTKAHVDLRLGDLPICKLAPFALLSLLTLLAGCQEPGGKLQPVSGRLHAQGHVTLKGEPLDTADIMFIPSTLIDKRNTDDWFFSNVRDGVFQVQLPPGTYDVRIQKYKYDSASKRKVPTLPRRYDQDSTFAATVTESGPNEFQYELDD